MPNVGKRFRDIWFCLHTLSTPENYRKAEWNKTKKIASNHFISFFLIYQQCKIYVKWVLIYSLQSEKKTTVKYNQIYPSKKEFPYYVIKRGMMRFTDGRSLFSNKIFATTTCTSKNFLILHNYPSHIHFDFLPHTTDALLLYLFIYSQQQPWCKFPCGVCKMILKILELGIHIYI